MRRRQPVVVLGLLLALPACDQTTSLQPTTSRRTRSAAVENPVADAATVSPSTIHGVNFFIKTQVDNTFCIEAQSGTSEGLPITLQTCGVADNQRWAFSDNSDGSNNVLDSEGMCLDGRFAKANDGLPMPVASCQFRDTWQFVYTSAGLIQNVRNGKCLAVPGAASNANVSLQDCDATKVNQQWLVTH